MPGNLLLSAVLSVSLFLTCFPAQSQETEAVPAGAVETAASELTLEQGKQAYKAERYAEAIRFLLPVLSTPGAHYYLGLSYYGLGLYGLAIDAFEVARGEYGDAPPPVDLLFSLGLSYYYANQIAPAQEYFDPHGQCHSRCARR